MKALNNINPLMILFGLLLFLIFQSCEKKLNGGVTCLAYMVADTLRFNIIDKNSNSDLFFSDNPAYSIEDIKVLKKNSINKFDTLALQVSSAGSLKYFGVQISAPYPQGEILYLKIADAALDTLSYTTVRDASSSLGCPRYILNTLKYNGSLIGENVHNKIISLKR